MKITSLLLAIPVTVSAFVFGWMARPEPLPQSKTIGSTPELAATVPVSLNSQASNDYKAIGEALFDSHHAKAVHLFDALPGNGFARIAPAVHHDLNGPGKPSIYSEFDFTFIGDDAASRKFADSEDAMIFSLMRAGKRGGSELETEVKPIGEGEKLALAEFNKDPEKPRVFHIDGDSLIAYGPLRAAKSCAKCHGVDEGTVLGMFRYQFDLPTSVNKLNLAAVFAAE